MVSETFTQRAAQPTLNPRICGKGSSIVLAAAVRAKIKHLRRACDCCIKSISCTAKPSSAITPEARARANSS